MFFRMLFNAATKFNTPKDFYHHSHYIFPETVSAYAGFMLWSVMMGGVSLIEEIGKSCIHETTSIMDNPKDL